MIEKENKQEKKNNRVAGVYTEEVGTQKNEHRSVREREKNRSSNILCGDELKGKGTIVSLQCE